MADHIKVCIHCGSRENLFQVGVVRGRFEVGLVFFCKDCQGVLEKSSLEVFLNHEEERETGQTLQ